MIGRESLSARERALPKAPLAKTELQRHAKEVRMPPRNEVNDRSYVAEGQLDLLGADSRLVTERQCFNWRPAMVAGACNAPNALVVPFRIELSRPAA
jgi:hypothetical protein